VEKIEKRLKARIETYDSKVDVIRYIWKKNSSKWFLIANRTGDINMIKILK